MPEGHARLGDTSPQSPPEDEASWLVGWTRQRTLDFFYQRSEAQSWSPEKHTSHLAALERVLDSQISLGSINSTTADFGIPGLHLLVSAHAIAKIVKGNDTPEVPEPPCKTCLDIGASGGFGPSHRGSRYCQSGSIASGGTESHCTCDTCF